MDRDSGLATATLVSGSVRKSSRSTGVTQAIVLAIVHS